MKEDKALIFKEVPKRLCLSEKQKQDRVTTIRRWMKDRIGFCKVIFADEVRFSVDMPDHFMFLQLKNYTGQYSRVKRPFEGGHVMLDHTLTV